MMLARNLVFYALLFGAFGYALWRGERTERIVAASLVIAFALTVVTLPRYGVRFRAFNVAGALNDLALFIILCLVSVWTTKFWPLWVAAMQGVTVLSHLSIFVTSVVFQTYGNAVALWCYPMLILLLTGTRAVDRKWRSAPT